jgi:VWFA-related protein
MNIRTPKRSPAKRSLPRPRRQRLLRCIEGRGGPLRASLLLLAASGLIAQDPPPQTTIRTTVDEVVLDVIVRDKKGKPIKDLTADDVVVLDNGVRQKITGFRLVEGQEAIDKGQKVALDPMRQLRLVTLCFERLDEDPRRIARQGALDLIKDPAPNVFYSVVTVDTQLFPLQQFTRDREALKTAIEKATSGKYAIFATEAAQLKAALDKTIAQAPQTAIQPGQVNDRTGPGADTSSIGSAAVEAKLAQVMRDMTSFDQAMAGAESTRRSIFSLLSLVRGQATLPGRKTILYFSAGMGVPPHLDVPFRSLISTANRNNVSFYVIDSRGVMTARRNEQAARAMLEAARTSAEDVTRQDGYVSKDAIQSSDKAETSMRQNDQLALRDLSESTGGFLMADSNDLRRPLRQVSEEVNSYYEISYNPGIEHYDGTFRKTEVTINRKDLVVHARNGYFALPPDLRGAPLLPYELPLLKALDSKPLPRELDFRASAVRFESGADAVNHELVLDVPLGQLQLAEDAVAQTYKARLSAVALVKNAQGEVVQKFSRDLPLAGSAAQIPQLKAGHFIYKEHLKLPPGRYTVETAVIDQESGKIAAKKAALVAPARTGGVALSSLSVVRSYQANVPGPDANDPFVYQGGRVTPALNPVIHTVPGAQLSIFFVVYPDPSSAEKPQAIMEYVLDGKSIGRGEVPLPEPDANGRIPYVMSAPAENLPHGTYEIRLRVKQGQSAAEERAFVTVEK